MKYFALVVAFAALAPSLVYAQNQQFSDCRTVKNAGNPRKIARAYQKDARAQRTTAPEKGNLEERKRGEEVERVKTQAVGAGIQTAIAQSPLDRRTPVSPAAAARPAMVKKSETAATPQSTALSAPAKAPQIAKDKAIAVPQAHPNTVKQQEVSLVTAEPIREPALKVATSLATAQAASPGVPAVQGPSPTEIPASGRNTPPKEQVGASPASGATADAPTSKPELSLTVGSFAIPRPTSADPPPQPQAYPAEEDAALKEGQVSTCVKNVSLGSMEKEKLFLAIPDWALNCYEKIQKRFSGIGFSDSLMPGARNYLIVFNTAAAHVAGNELTKVSAVGEATPAVGSFYDQLWLYVALHLPFGP